MTDRPATPPRVAIVHLGREAAMGGMRRVAGLVRVFEGAGAEVHDVRLLSVAKSTPATIPSNDLIAVASGRAVPETLAWSRRRALERLVAIDPDLVICSTARSFDPSFEERWPTVIDFIDRLSVSYADRGSTGRGPAQIGYRVLADRMRRFEQRFATGDRRRMAAGWADAEALGADWVPITVPLGPFLGAAAREPFRTTDAVFVGNLAYPPNVGAVEQLSRIWPRVQASHPGARLTLAGAKPVPEVRQRAAEGGWTVQADFDELDDVLAPARIAVAPLTHASGIQTKVLEAAARGVPQVVSPAARAGLDPAFPIRVAGDDASFADAIVDLLASEHARGDEGGAAQRHIAAEYVDERWVPWAKALLDDLR